MSNERDLGPALKAAFEGKVVYPCLLFKMDTAVGPVYIWSGIGDLIWDGNTFQGAGHLASVDVIPEGTDLTANGINVSFNGIPTEYLSLVLNSTQNRYNATLWFGSLDSAGVLVADPYQLFQGLTDVPEIQEGADTCSITIACENKYADLNRSRVEYYTPEDQKRIDPTDKGFDFVAGLQNAAIIFA